MLRKVDENLLATAAQDLRISGLCKRFRGGAPVLDGIDLEVAQGELITVLGPSGSGKTTLLRLLCGFEHADAGRIELGGRTVVDGRRVHLPPERRGIGYVAQEGALFPHLSVAENLLFGLPRKLRKATRGEQTRRVRELLDLVDLPAEFAARKPAALSGGEQQRVTLARALAPEPAIVLLDEPFSALDAGLRAGLRAMIAGTLQRAHATALLVTHDQDEALSMGSRVAVLHGGRFAQVATPQVLYRRPASAAVARFVGEAVFVPGTATDGMVESCFGRLPLATEPGEAGAAGGPVDVMIRPEQFQLFARGSEQARANGELQIAQVEQLQYYGHDARLLLRLGDGPQFTATVPGFDIPTPGQEVNVRVVGKVLAYPRENDHKTQ